MQTSIMPSRLDSMPLLVPATCRSPEPTASAAELLSQCTTEWSRYFIASTIAPRAGKYTEALTADLRRDRRSPHLEYPAYPSAATTAAPLMFGLGDSASSGSSTDDAATSADSPSPSVSPPGRRPLRKVASCAVTGREKSRKRVQFADEVGQALTRVKFLTDSLSHLPVETRIEPVASSEHSQQQPMECSLQLKCRFSQPSARYIVFREFVEHNLVCLSLVHPDLGMIRGAIVVKNVSFRKRVFARVTFNSWHSFHDVEAGYNGSEGQLDSFTFRVQCPKDQETDIQFCVCYECELGTHWDSNGGENYRVSVSRSADGNGGSGGGYTKDFKPNFSGVTEFSEFSAWEHFTDQVYY